MNLLQKIFNKISRNSFCTLHNPNVNAKDKAMATYIYFIYDASSLFNSALNFNLLHPAQWEMPIYGIAAWEVGVSLIFSEHNGFNHGLLSKSINKNVIEGHKVIVMGQGKVFSKLIADKNDSALYILLATESHPKILKKAENLAVKDALTYNLNIKKIRQFKGFISDDMVEIADKILVIGSNFSAKTFPKNKVFKVINPTCFRYNRLINQDKFNKKNTILWVGSSGMALKGFHWLYLMAKEIKHFNFIAIGVNFDELKDKFRDLPNLICFEFIDFESEEGTKILNETRFGFLPYYCEGMTTAGLSLLGFGIPLLVSKEAGLDDLVPKEYVIEELNYKFVHSAILSCLSDDHMHIKQKNGIEKVNTFISSTLRFKDDIKGAIEYVSNN